MKKLLVIGILLALFASQVPALAAQKDLNLAVKQLYSAPAKDSSLVYEIPVEVVLLDISTDGNWYKVKISYNIGPFMVLSYSLYWRLVWSFTNKTKRNQNKISNKTKRHSSKDKSYQSRNKRVF